jgi:hypothetical protein
MGAVIASKVGDVGVEDGGQEGDDHAYLIVSRGAERVTVDIPASVYEVGGGYRWRKREGVHLGSNDVDLAALREGSTSAPPAQPLPASPALPAEQVMRDLDVLDLGGDEDGVVAGIFHGYRVRLVDANRIKDDREMDFTEGGNHYRYAWIPTQELWVSLAGDLLTRRSTVYHEWIEATTMAADSSVTYDRAHAVANAGERNLRQAYAAAGDKG